MLSRDELRTMKVRRRAMRLRSNSGAATNSAALANGARAAVNGHGWAMLAVDGRPALGRSHPLTVEGDDVGTFDLNFACGEPGRDYIVTYIEQRPRRRGRTRAGGFERGGNFAGRQAGAAQGRGVAPARQVVGAQFDRQRPHAGRGAEGLRRSRQPLADGGDRKRRCRDGDPDRQRRDRADAADAGCKLRRGSQPTIRNSARNSARQGG